MKRLCEMTQQYGPLVGRILMAYIFVLSGFGKLTSFAGTAGYMASSGLPFAELLTAGAICVELGGGILLVLGWQTRWAAAALVLFTIPATLMFHAYWVAEAAQVQAQMIHFNKNLAIMGGLLYVVTFGAGPLSLDNRRR